MTITYQQFMTPVVLGIASAELFEIAEKPTTNLLRGGRMRLTNTSASAVSVTLYGVPFGGTAADSNAFVKGKTVPPNDYLDVDIPLIAAGGSVHGLAGVATSITAHMISGSLFS